ncbi:MAG TPA: hypothetical protein VFY67_15805 [Pyrinomonadaceae bacterium]|nr:hypothetical protein [Pyrinomonadaceae bacterium]
MKRLVTPWVLLVVVHSTAVAQTDNKAPRPAKSRSTVESTAKAPKSTADEMREHELRVFREHVLARTLDNIKKMDEAGLRLSVRNQLLSYLVTDKVPSDEKQALATQIARDALIDLSEHHKEITPFMLGYLSNNLRSWIQKYRPNLIEDFEKTAKATVEVNASQHIRSLFELEGGDRLAAKRIRQELEDHGSLEGLFFWLDELMRRNSSEFEPVAADVVERARRGQISCDTLFWISDIYLRPQVSNALRNRFLAAVVARTQPANFVAEPAPQLAHDLLLKLLPVIQQSSPELYDQAQNNSFAIRAALNERQRSNDARIKRLRESGDPIGDLKSEAQSAKTKAERDELLLRAAELALEKKKFQLCLDILDSIDITAAAADSNWRLSIDQLLKNLVKACLKEKSADLAEKGVARIGSILTKVESLSLIIRYYAKADEKEAAQRLLLEASKVAASGPESPDKAKAFFLLSLVCEQVDRTQKADLLLSGIKAMNNLSQPDASARNTTAYQTYVQLLDNTGHELTKAFTRLTTQDQNGALALVEKLEKRDLKTFALIGVLLGLDELLVTPSL